MVGNYKVITLCGSTRFKEEFLEVQKRLTLEGNIVISVGLFGHSGDKEVWESMDEGTLTKTKEMLDDMHKRKIDMADEVFVINKHGYIGESTRSEIVYALTHGKKVNYLEPVVVEKKEEEKKKTRDMTSFVKRMRDMRDGKEVDWSCPFCGAKVILYNKDDTHTEIGCESCDMRINLDIT